MLKDTIKKVIVINDNSIPMVGSLAFGIVDRGSNIIEVRPTTICGLSCVFCSVNAGPKSKVRWAEFIVKRDLLLNAVSEVIRYKVVNGIEIHIDGMGDPGNYPELVELVQDLKSLPNIRVVSVQTRLYMLNEDKIKQLDEAGLDRINLSLDSLDPLLAKKLTNTSTFEVKRVLDLVDYTLNNTNIDVILSPVWLKNINDQEIEKLVKWSYEKGLGKKWPPILIQKFIPHKRGRIPKGVKVVDWNVFYNDLKNLETKLGYRLLFDSSVFNIFKTVPLPIIYSVGEKVKVRVVEKGIFKGEYLAVPINLSGTNITDRVITIVAPQYIDEEVFIGSKLNVLISENKDNIYVAKIV